ncbi:hypothetical protein [Archaeoglobus sp.]
MRKLKHIKATPEILKELEGKVKHEHETEKKRRLGEVTSKHTNLDFVSLRVKVNEPRVRLNAKTLKDNSHQGYVLNPVSLDVGRLRLKSIGTTVDTHRRNLALLTPSKGPDLRLDVKIDILSPRLMSFSKPNLRVRATTSKATLQPKPLLNLNLTQLKFALEADYTIVIREFPSLKTGSIKIRTSSDCSTLSSQGVVAPAVNIATIPTRIVSMTKIPARVQPFPTIQRPSLLILQRSSSAHQKSTPMLKPTDLSFSIVPPEIAPAEPRSNLFPEHKIHPIRSVRIVSIAQEQIVRTILNLTPRAFKLKLNIVDQIQQEFPVPKFRGFKVNSNIDTRPIELYSVLNITIRELKPRLSPLQTKFETRLTFQDLIESLTEVNTIGILEEFLNVRGYIPRGSSDALDKPIFVIVGEDKKDWHNIVAYMLSELYREIRGEKPVPTIRELNNEDNIDSTVEKFLMVGFKTWGKVEILDARDFDKWRFESFIKKLRGRLLSSYLQGLGFFVIVTRNEHVEDIEELLEDVRGMNKVIIQPEYGRVKSTNVTILKPSDRRIVDRRYRKAVFSVLGIEYDDFLKAVEIRDSKIRSIVKSLSPFVPRTESEGEHYPLKVAVFSWIVSKEFEKSNSKPKNRDEFVRFVKALIDSGIVRIEEPIEQNIVPDITYKAGDETVYIEIETLIGTEDPMAKVQRTISKYVDNGIGGQIWVVLKPVSALIHYSELKNLKRFYDVTLGNNPVQFKVIINENNRWNLIDIDEFVRRLRSVH